LDSLWIVGDMEVWTIIYLGSANILLSLRDWIMQDCNPSGRTRIQYDGVGPFEVARQRSVNNN
jgi:hypothetical protein